MKNIPICVMHLIKSLMELNWNRHIHVLLILLSWNAFLTSRTTSFSQDKKHLGWKNQKMKWQGHLISINSVMTIRKTSNYLSDDGSWCELCFHRLLRGECVGGWGPNLAPPWCLLHLVRKRGFRLVSALLFDIIKFPIYMFVLCPH